MSCHDVEELYRDLSNFEVAFLRGLAPGLGQEATSFNA